MGQAKSERRAPTYDSRTFPNLCLVSKFSENQWILIFRCVDSDIRLCQNPLSAPSPYTGRLMWRPHPGSYFGGCSDSKSMGREIEDTKGEEEEEKEREEGESP